MPPRVAGAHQLRSPVGRAIAPRRGRVPPNAPGGASKSKQPKGGASCQAYLI